MISLFNKSLLKTPYRYNNNSLNINKSILYNRPQYSYNNRLFTTNINNGTLLLNNTDEASSSLNPSLNNNNNNEESLNTSNNSNNNNNENQQKTKKIKIKIKSKDPYLELAGNKKIYFSKQKQQERSKLRELDLVDKPLLDVDLNFNLYNHGFDSSQNFTTDISRHNDTELISSIPSAIVDKPKNIRQSKRKKLEMALSNMANGNSNDNTIATNNVNSSQTDSNNSNSNINVNINNVNNMPNNNNKIETNISQASDSSSPTISTMADGAQKHTVLIDGTLMAYKVHATGKSLYHLGENVTILYGFIRSLLKVINNLNPVDNIVVCFDPKGGSSYRKEMFPQYKSQRPSTPQDVLEQFKKLPEITDSLGIKFAVMNGFECDDLLASYARQACDRGDRVTIVSEDKDLLQLVRKNVSVYNVRTDTMMDESEVFNKYGIEPNKLVTLQSLIGDKVDNIPGIPKIGPKTATEIIKQYGTLHEIIDNIEALPQKFIDPIKNSIDQLMVSYQLVTLDENVDLEIPLSSLEFKPIDKTKFLNFLEKYQFNTIKNQLRNYKLKFLNEEGQEELASNTREYSKIEYDYVDDEHYKFEEMSNEEINQLKPKNVTMVRDVETAKKAVATLMQHKNKYHACDTETIAIDLKKVSPIGHGRMICFSIYCGPDVKFFDGNTRLWVDVMDDINGEAVLQEFKEYFEDESILKVWHNYAFDRHIFYNHNINVKGFGGDTLHMARLWNAARQNSGGYSLEALCRELLNKTKTPIKDLFGQKKIKANGEAGKAITIPPLQRIQRDRRSILDWIEYSSLDSELTWSLRENLHMKLEDMVWTQNSTMWDFYYLNWRPFGHLLTEMEQRGMKIDIDYLKNLESTAFKDMEENRNRFISWASKHSEGAKYMNPDSDAQIQQLLFAPVTNKKTKEEMPKSKDFETENVEGIIEEGRTKPKKNMSFILDGLGFPSNSVTTSGWPSVDASALRELAGKSPENGKFGTAYQFFVDKSENKEEGEALGKEACLAIASLLELGTIGTLLNTFIIPLQKLADKNSRLHTSVNVNTETGRLSSRKPNLQNQPALEKDRYKIRKAFTCEPGNTLIVADYGQLELRLLAHITNCKSMISAFKVGGDFHSRTAMGMYPHVKEAVDKGEVLLEWDGDGEPPKPLLKNIFASERRKAKTLNFSIAYGKTAHGLSTDWGVTLKEAQETLNRWYEDRPEVLVWQRKTIATAHSHKWTRTLMGRYRHLPDIDNSAKGMKNHAERASINTPLQGGAADIVMKAMLIIEDNKRIKELGYKLIMQIHDELILEGPEENADEARGLVMNLMSNPLTTPLLIDLVVDCRYAKTWYEAK
ncbi:hypothetical protein DICPUDRAFT_158421 [Dictyostelium purpureum]|uniref:Uncharacterized protein n=1 Tax=Dictyostelium purpureum TaxID=5786 RepID=F1A1K6_DICPU|nr:uncharacterized protein DICPUDRAFT_158421 [Dictyostelium purpureum]EGC29930.1 hypothetical protein DICPUDRAFT_158421 [Dictyostelium purpureum]|eukprot:XP_003293552.1 hypothetical protein DICPUDRAFT_158421 [Dictyostelium purpureum]